MIKRIFIPILVFNAAMLWAGVSFAQPLVSSTQLIDRAGGYDGQVVTYAGEVIGDVMKRGDFAWVNINDGINAVGAWMSISLARHIGYSGSYKNIGDAVEVTGVFRRACPEHGGDLDIHAQSMRKVAPGRFAEPKINIDKRDQVFILLGALAAVWILTMFARK